MRWSSDAPTAEEYERVRYWWLRTRRPDGKWYPDTVVEVFGGLVCWSNDTSDPIENVTGEWSPCLTPDAITSEIAAAVAEERERCAKVCVEVARTFTGNDLMGLGRAIDRVAAAIRALPDAGATPPDRLAEIDRLLTEDFGGWYVDAPDNEPLGKVRALLRGTK
jgi:hypothetical protein